MRSTPVASSPAEVWQTIHDVDLLSSFSSHLGSVTTVETGRSWEVSLQDRIGPLRLSAPMHVEIVAETAETEVSIRAWGQDRGPGTRLVVEAAVRIDGADRATNLILEGWYELTGRAARIGAGVARRQAERMVDEFWSNLTGRLGPVKERHHGPDR